MAKIDRQIMMVAFDAFKSLCSNGLSRKEAIEEINTKFGIPPNTLYDWYKNSHIPYGRKGTISYRPEIYYVMGALLGDGCLYKWKPTNNFVILVGDEKFTTKYSTRLEKCISRKVKPYIDRSKNIWFVRTNNFELYELFKKLRNNLGYLRNLITKAGKKSALLFIEGFFDAEGCIKVIKEKVRITPKICPDITNTNLELINLVRQLILETMGIQSAISVQKAYGNAKIAYHLRIYRKDDVRTFLKYVHTTKLKGEKIRLVRNWLNKF
ncbi:MAG TPA: LAGLIDADG family homing endonuclease [Candidatus Paceibacterota bacterium]